MSPSISCSPIALKEHDSPSPNSSAIALRESEKYKYYKKVSDDYYVYQKVGQPKQSKIGDEFWSPIFTPECVRSVHKNGNFWNCKTFCLFYNSTKSSFSDFSWNCSVQLLLRSSLFGCAIFEGLQEASVLTLITIFKQISFRGSKKLKIREGDVFVCTYPKCGTTWVQHICAQLMHDSYGPEAGNGIYLKFYSCYLADSHYSFLIVLNCNRSGNWQLRRFFILSLTSQKFQYVLLSISEVISELSLTSPMIERMGPDYIAKLGTPRLLKTHYTWKNLPKSPLAKYIFCVRNPKDCLTR